MNYITTAHARDHRLSSAATNADHWMTTDGTERNTRWFHDANNSPESHCGGLFVTISERIRRQFHVKIWLVGLLTECIGGSDNFQQILKTHPG